VFTEIFVEIPPEASGRQGTGDDASSIFIDGVRRSGEDLAEEIVRKIDFSAKL
jgi:hypothetical protein